MNPKTYPWVIIGAGPAGIMAVGKLLDNHIDPSHILWIDPHFNVGDLGEFYRNVSSNTKVDLFIKFFQASRAFAYHQSPIDYLLNHLDPQNTCVLNAVVEPLKWITHQLCKAVNCEKAMIHSITLSNRTWNVYGDTCHFVAKNVILATGAIPEVLQYPETDTIPFHVAIDKQKLCDAIRLDDTYAVFGSSHSAIIILQNLVELGVKKIINFYRSPCRYAVDMGEAILFDNVGLKGNAALWARKHIDGTLPNQLHRYVCSDENIARLLPECNKAIYAVGFKTRNTIAIGDYAYRQYNPHVGIIGPGLFGLGIAYPEIKEDSFGNVESQVGIWKFMVYLNKILPIWFKYHV